MKAYFFRNPHIVIPALGCIVLIGAEFPIWFLGMNLVFLMWRFMGEQEFVPLPPRWLTSVLSLMVFGLIIFTYHTLFDREASPLFFCSLCSLKILEYRNQRDHLFIVLLLMFLLAAKFLFSIDIWILPFAVWFMYHLWMSLLPRRRERGFLPWKMRLYFLRGSLLSLPLAFALYFGFPRINSYLLKSNLNGGKGISSTGFGNEIRPGSIAQLAQSHELVFRTEIISGPLPEANELYWRGLVLRNTDGFRWSQGNSTEDIVTPDDAPARTTSYKTTMEPSRQRWTFPLDYPVQLFGQGTSLLRSRDGLFQTVMPFEYRIVLLGKSQSGIRMRPKSEKPYLVVPPATPGLAKLIAKFTNGAHGRREIVSRIKSFFANGGFAYTLNPGEMSERRVDEFIFRVKKGFCEHFASAFGILARLSGVPTRVVIGYQGAEYNKIANFYTVSSQDAHAWNEIVNDEGNWERVDIIDLIAPVRTAMGAAEFLKLPEEMRGFKAPKKAEEVPAWAMIYEFSTMYLESWNFYWTQWLLDFNLDKQSEFLKFLPVPLALMLFVFVALIFMIFVVTRTWSYWSDKRNLVDWSYRRLLKWAREHGCPKELWEGPEHFGERLKGLWPAQAAEIELIIDNYIRFTFADKKIAVEDLTRMANSLRKIELST